MLDRIAAILEEHHISNLEDMEYARKIEEIVHKKKELIK